MRPNCQAFSKYRAHVYVALHVYVHYKRNRVLGTNIILFVISLWHNKEILLVGSW